MGEIAINTGNIDISHTLLGQIQQNPEGAFDLLIADEHIGKSKVHLCLVLIEQGLYRDNEEKFLNLSWSSEDKNRMRKHAMHIRGTMNMYYDNEQAVSYMRNLIKALFPDQVRIAELLNNDKAQ